MKIHVDQNILQAREAFGLHGAVELYSGRELTQADLRQSDALITRSQTMINRELLQDTAVKFVGTATIGTDHVDEDALLEMGIGFANAAGSNAEAVAAYVFTAIADWLVAQGRTFSDTSIGIVGVGNIGRRVQKLAETVGMVVKLNDPPRAAHPNAIGFVDLDEVLDADIVTLHVPLTKSGEHATHHLLNAQTLQQLRDDVLLINSARGPVIDEIALLAWALEHPDAELVLDVWEHEPKIQAELLRRVRLATPHIAGYSLEGKYNGTAMVYAAFCRHFDVQPQWQPELPQVKQPRIRARGDAGFELALREATLAVYDMYADDANMRAMLELPASERAGYFDSLRKKYQLRRDFSNFQLRLEPMDINYALVLNAFGFRVVE